MDASEFQSRAGVSRETCARLQTYHARLLKWQKAINLVAPSTLGEAWSRHFYDSAQLWSLVEHVEGPLYDLGSGAGFPGLVLAVMGRKDVHLVESDTRKATFLRETARETGADVTVHNTRIEDLEDADAGIVTARALAALDTLLSLSYPLVSAKNGRCVFLKGGRWEEEVEQARENWNFDLTAHDSATAADARILEISNLCPK